jgi:large subunit ribosomal protein L11
LKIEMLIEGGKATPGPPLGPALGPIGVNVVEVANKINEATKAFEGVRIPVKIDVDSRTKEFTIQVGTPPTSVLILQKIGKEKGSANPKSEKIGDISLESLREIADMKSSLMVSSDPNASLLEVLGTCVSLGVTVDGKEPKGAQRMVKEEEGHGDKG